MFLILKSRALDKAKLQLRSIVVNNKRGKTYQSHRWVALQQAMSVPQPTLPPETAPHVHQMHQNISTSKINRYTKAIDGSRYFLHNLGKGLDTAKETLSMRAADSQHCAVQAATSKVRNVTKSINLADVVAKNQEPNASPYIDSDTFLHFLDSAYTSDMNYAMFEIGTPQLRSPLVDALPQDEAAQGDHLYFSVGRVFDMNNPDLMEQLSVIDDYDAIEREVQGLGYDSYFLPVVSTEGDQLHRVVFDPIRSLIISNLDDLRG